MKKLGIGPKTYRSVEFLLGLRNRDVAKELEPFGFTKDRLDEGWGLLADATGARLAGIADAAPSQPRLLQRIDEFENTWFPVARNVLARHYPDAEEQAAELTRGGAVGRAIARVAIKSRATLRKLGFFKRRTSGSEDEPIEVADLGEPSAPEPDTAELDGQPEARQLAEPVTA